MTILRLLLPAALAGLSVGLTLLVRADATQDGDQHFERMVDDNLDALTARMRGYNLAVDGVAGLYDASAIVTNDELRTYVRTLDIEENVPGINGLGIVLRVTHDTMPAFLEGQRAIGLPDTEVHPRSAAEEHYIVSQIEPSAWNRGTLGFDLATDPLKRETALDAARSGAPRLSPSVTLSLQGSGTKGFVLLVPIYEPGLPVDTESERLAALRGWAFAPFIGSLVLSDLTESQGKLFDFEVYDGSAIEPDRLIYGTQRPGASNSADRARYTRSLAVEFFDRRWLLRWSSTPEFEALTSRVFHWWILGGGLLITGLVTLVAEMLLRREKKVRLLVGRRTEELREREQENRAVVQNAMIGIITVSGNDIISSLNIAATRILQIKRLEVIGRDVKLVIPGLSTAPMETKIEYLPPDGDRERLLNIQVSSWIGIDGAERKTIMFEDVTDRDRAVRRIEENEARWNLAMRGAGIGVFDIDLRTGKSVVSETWKTLMGLEGTPHDFDHQAYFLAHVHPDDLPILQAADEACLKGETDRSVAEFRVETETRGTRWMRSDAVVVDRTEGGKPLRLIGAQTDITELVNSRSAFRASEDRFRMMTQFAPVGMLILDEAFRITDANRLLAELTGHPQELLMQKFRVSGLFSARDWERLKFDLSELSPEGNPLLQTELEVQTVKGIQRWCVLNATVARDPVNERLIYILQFLDISDAKEMDRIKTEFIATVNHELRTPLTSIRGAIGILELTAKEKFTQAETRLIDIAKTNASRLTDIINDILDLERIQSVGLRFENRVENLGEILNSARDQILPIAVQKGLDIAIEGPNSDIMVNVDRKRLTQVMSNLLSNACKFSPEKERIQIVFGADEEFARIAVVDRGPGVPKTFEEKLFTPFSQADSSDTREKGGTGLGLSIAREIIRRMGGDIGYERSRSGETVFWFSLPVADRASLQTPRGEVA